MILRLDVSCNAIKISRFNKSDKGAATLLVVLNVLFLPVDIL